MGAAGQLLLLTWKNWKVSLRNVCATVFEILLPLAFALLLLVIRFLVKREDITSVTEWASFQVNNISHYTDDLDTKTEILYAPNGAKITEVMNKFTANADFAAFGTVQSFASEAAALDYYEVHPNTVWAIVVFDESVDYSSALPDAISYRLRVRRKSADDDWETEINFPFFQNPSYRDNKTESGRPFYYETGFLYIQYMVDKFIIDVDAAANTLDTDTVISMQKMPFPAHIRDLLLNILQGTLPLFLILAFIVNVFQTTKNLAVEKEMKLKESMKLMGMNGNMYWFSWFLKALSYSFVACLFFTFALHINAGANGAILANSHPTLTFLFLMLFALSLISFCFMISAMFAKANSAAYAAGILYFLLYVPYFLVQDQYQTMTLGQKMGYCLINNMAMAFGVLVLSGYEGTGEGVQWNNFHEPPSIDDNFTLLYAMLMLLLDTVVFAIVAWYVGNIRPGDFGVPEPWYFPFTKVYWCGPDKGIDTSTTKHNQNDDEKFEPDPTGLKIGISINHLRKEFGKGKHMKVAVADTNMNLYEGHVTVLLGHNGAGKTTTMSMLTGFLPPTSGTAIIDGCDLRKDLLGIRKRLGLCPQHDILFPNLTVTEHLEFYAKLKGIEGKDVKHEVESMLETLKLQHKKNNRSATLSGGQKRKLSVGISLIADSKVIVLDEPTSGMDPSARRETWEIIQKYREGRTILLTTHFMDEADLLGDRIAIMSDGVIKCCGTSLFLKKAYGAGYHLVIVKTAQCSVDKVTNLVVNHIPSATMESHISAELSYLLPFDQSAKFEKLFEELEKRSSELGLSSFGTSATTMEEVFLKVGEQSADEDNDDIPVANRGNAGSPGASSNVSSVSKIQLPPINGAKNQAFEMPQDNGSLSKINIAPIPPINGSTNGAVMKQMEVEQNGRQVTGRPVINKNKGMRLSLQQVYAMVIKKAIHTWRNRVITFVQLLLPVVFAILALVSESTGTAVKDEPQLNLDLTPFKSPAYFYQNVGGTAFTNDATTKYQSSFSGITAVDAGSGTIVAFVETTSASTSITQFFQKHLVGAQFTATDSIAYFNGEGFHTPGIALNHLMDGFRKKYVATTKSISVANHPIPLSEADKSDKVQTTALALGFTVAFLTLFGMAFLTTSFILFLIKERFTGAKHLQKVSGVSSFAYWISNFIWDLFNYMIPVVLIIIVFAAFNKPAYTGDSRLGIVFLAFLVYGICCLPFVYFLHYAFTVPSTGMTAITMLNIVTGLATLLAVFILEIPSLGTEDVAKAIDWISTILFPHYCLGQVLNNMYVNYDLIRTCEAANYQTTCAILNTLPCCSGCTGSTCYSFDSNYLAWEKPGAGRYITFMLLQFVFYSIMVMLIEIGVIDQIRYKTSSSSSAVANENEEHLINGSGKDEDDDVVHERKRLNSSAITSLMETDALVIKNLSKSYGSFHAVKGISVGVPKCECFGLLGQNGAGKTTTFKMLTGDVRVSRGNAYLDSHDIKTHLKEVQQSLGYCPQFDALVDQMTGRETLNMYARLRGVPENEIKYIVNELIDTLMLRKHADKKTEAYSGGNKRKLSTAVALIGDPPFILLDEPTTGMDPGARRQLWNVLSDVRASGRTLVLTSHSMEECDALCTKIVIMVNGQFVCLGSPQHLKNKFGHGYTLIIRTGSPGVGATALIEINVKNFIKEKFPNSQIFDSHQGYVHFQIPDADVPLARVFGAMETCKREINIEDYSVHQTTLEQVFLTFTRNQIQHDQTKKKTFGCC